MKLRLDGKLDDLLHEGHTIQRRLTLSQQSLQKDNDRTARLFAKHMMEVKVRGVLRLVTQANGSGPLPLNSIANPNDPTNTQCLRDIHPSGHLKDQPSLSLTHLWLNPTLYYSMK